MKIVSLNNRVVNWIFKEANLNVNQWNKMKEVIKDKLKQAPKDPGVYQFLNSAYLKF